MDEIRGWAFGLCAAAIACGVMQLLLPKSSMQGVFNVTVSVFFLGCLLSPVLFTLPEKEDLTFAQEELQSEIDKRSENLTAQLQESQVQMASGTLRQEAGRVLNELAVDGGKIYINIHETDEEGISISECEVQLPREYEPRHDEIRAELNRRLGVNVIIGYEVEKKE